MVFVLSLDFKNDILYGTKILPILSDPTSEDGDLDGIEDISDVKKLDGRTQGEFHTRYSDSDLSYVMDYSSFFYSNTNYNSDLCTTSSIFASTIYVHSQFNNMNIEEIMELHGLKDVKTYMLGDFDNSDILSYYTPAYVDNHISEITIGHKKVEYDGEVKEVIAISVRGTNGTIEEWSSNFDVGSTEHFDAYQNFLKTGDTSAFDSVMMYYYENDKYELDSFSDWTNKENHKGFDIASTRILQYIDVYVNMYIDKTIDKCFWLTGHSRGAAIANIVSSNLIDSGNEVFTYTFASPNTTTSANADNACYDCIFNVVNADDFVPCLPANSWGFKRYGRTAKVSIDKKYESEWNSTFKLTDDADPYFSIGYDNDSTFDNTVEKLSACAKDRNDCYSLEDVSCRNVTIYDGEKSSLVPFNCKPYLISIYTSEFEDENKITVYYTFQIQSPMYYFQLISAYMGKKDGKKLVTKSDFVFAKLANEYGSAHSSLIAASGFAGIEHPHYPESYYILAKNVYANLFI
jgi:hypothetical protein